MKATQQRCKGALVKGFQISLFLVYMKNAVFNGKLYILNIAHHSGHMVPTVKHGDGSKQSVDSIGFK